MKIQPQLTAPTNGRFTRAMRVLFAGSTFARAVGRGLTQ